MLEPRRPRLPAATDPMDSRVVACSRASERILEAAGAWEAIAARRDESLRAHARVARKRGARSDPARCASMRPRSGEPNLGYIVENRLVQAALLDAAEAAGARIVAGEHSVRYGSSDDVRARRNLRRRIAPRSSSSAPMEPSSPVRACGRVSTAEIDWLRADSDRRDRRHRATHERTAWQRFLRTGTLAFLPLADGTSSIVWSADDDARAALLLGGVTSGVRSKSSIGPRDQCARGDAVAGRAGVLSPCAGSPRIGSWRIACALIGDAAHVVHPLAGARGESRHYWMPRRSRSRSIAARARTRRSRRSAHCCAATSAGARAKRTFMRAAIDALRSLPGAWHRPALALGAARTRLGESQSQERRSAFFIRTGARCSAGELAPRRPHRATTRAAARRSSPRR